MDVHPPCYFSSVMRMAGKRQSLAHFEAMVLCNLNEERVCSRSAPGTIFKNCLLSRVKSLSEVKEINELWVEKVSVLLNSGTVFFTPAVPDKLSPSSLRLAPQCVQGSKSAFICLCGLPQLSLAHIQRKEEKSCFYWPEWALPRTWRLFHSECLPAGKEAWMMAKRKHGMLGQQDRRGSNWALMCFDSYRHSGSRPIHFEMNW